jgi:hypothetical protein
MRKTARPVVWEGAGAQSPAPDPIEVHGKDSLRLEENPEPQEGVNPLRRAGGSAMERDHAAQLIPALVAGRSMEVTAFSVAIADGVGHEQRVALEWCRQRVTPRTEFLRDRGCFGTTSRSGHGATGSRWRIGSASALGHTLRLVLRTQPRSGLRGAYDKGDVFRRGFIGERVQPRRGGRK